MECIGDPAKWIEAFVKVKGKPVKLYDFQTKYVRMKGNIVVVKARQLGISWITAAKALYNAMHNSDRLILLLSLTKEQAVELMRKAIQAYNSLPDRAYLGDSNDWIQIKMPVVTRGGEPSKTLLEFVNGSRIVALPNNPEAVRGYAADEVDWDEAAQFPHEEDMIAALEPTTSRGGSVSYISTHRGTQARFYDLTQKVKSKHQDFLDYNYIEIPWTEMLNPNPITWANRAREDPEIIAYLKKMEKFKREFGEKSFFFLEEYCCIASDESVAMFSHECLRAAMALWRNNNCSYREPTRRYPVYVGLDIGRVKDSTVLIAFEDMPEYVQVIKIKEYTGMTFPEQKALLREDIKNLHPTFIRIDHKGIGADIAETFSSELGSQTQLMEFTVKEKEMMVLNTYVKMTDKKIAIPPDTDDLGIKLYSQLHNVRREITPKTATIRYVQSDENMHDDFMWAFCMGASLLITPTQPIIMGGISASENTSMVRDEGTKQVDVTVTKKEPLQAVLTGIGLIREEEKRKKKDYDDFMLRVSANPKHYDCPTCLTAHRLDTCDKNLCKWSGGRPQLEKQNTKLAMADEYICHVCMIVQPDMAIVVRVKK